MLVAESVDPDHPAHEWFVTRYKNVRTGMAGAFGEEQRAGRMRSELDPTLVARQVIAMFDGIQLQYLLAGGAAGSRVTPLRALLDSYR